MFPLLIFKGASITDKLRNPVVFKLKHPFKNDFSARHKACARPLTGCQLHRELMLGERPSQRGFNGDLFKFNIHGNFSDCSLNYSAVGVVTPCMICSDPENKLAIYDLPTSLCSHYLN